MALPRYLLGCFGLTLGLLQAVVVGRGEQSAPLRFDHERLGRLDAVIQGCVDQKQISGAVMYLAQNGQSELLKAYGQRDIEAGAAMRPDTIFRLASMSKAVTIVTALTLYEEGKFMLNDPVSKYIPEFARSMVAVPPPADAPAGTPYVTVPAKRPITIRDLMRHTAGLTYGDSGSLAADDYKAANLQGWYFGDHDELIGDAIKRLAKLPLHGQPGEAWQYGFGTDVLGYLIEVVAGKPLDQVFAERVLGPLKMVDTCFYLPPEKEGRLATVYAASKAGLARGDQGDFVRGPRKCFSGGAGLMSTAHDYGRFLQMLLNGGELDGVRVLSPKTVELMHANHTGDKYRRDVSGYGLGFWVNEDPGFYGELSSEGSYGWGSAYYPQYFVDPKEKLVAFILTQLRPTNGLDLNQKFKVLVYQALVP